MVSGVLHGVDLGGVARTIRNALRGELIAPEARTPFQGFSGHLRRRRRRARQRRPGFNTTDLRIPGIGVIDLNARRLDVRLAPRAARRGHRRAVLGARAVRGARLRLRDLRGRARAEIEPADRGRSGRRAGPIRCAQSGVDSPCEPRYRRSSPRRAKELGGAPG